VKLFLPFPVLPADVFLSFVCKRYFFVVLPCPQASAVKLFVVHHTMCMRVCSSWRRVITSDQQFLKGIAVSVNPKAPLRGNQPLCECCRGMSVMVQQARHRQLPLPRVVDKVNVQFWGFLHHCMYTDMFVTGKCLTPRAFMLGLCNWCCLGTQMKQSRCRTLG